MKRGLLQWGGGSQTLPRTRCGLVWCGMSVLHLLSSGMPPVSYLISQSSCVEEEINHQERKSAEVKTCVSGPESKAVPTEA